MGPTRIESKLLVWGSDEIESGTIEQAAKSARLPFVDGHVALMPDAHVGIGATVGSVIPTRGAIIPAAVGVDIGCGMIAARLPFTSNALPDDLAPLHADLVRSIPAGVGRGHEHEKHGAAYLAKTSVPLAVTKSPELGARAARQFGTLGSGNHFVELCLDERDRVWIVLHSGSRGVGNQLATQHIEAAKGLMRRYFIDLEDPDLAYFVEGTAPFEQYVHDMLWAQDYARHNRERMIAIALECVARFLGREADPEESVNCHHNFTEREQHHGRDLWVTRKGAIRARQGDRGVIPGSMGTRSYIVSGLGNPASFDSCSHGAGRRMSRGQARRSFTADDLKARMGDRTWNAASAQSLIDEIPDAYKDIDAVMEAQRDLVRVDHTLRQILNMKGT